MTDRLSTAQKKIFQTDWETYLFSYNQTDDFQSSAFFISSTFIYLEGELYGAWIKHTNYTSLRFIIAFYHKWWWDVKSLWRKETLHVAIIHTAPSWKHWVRQNSKVGIGAERMFWKCSEFLNSVLGNLIIPTLWDINASAASFLPTVSVCVCVCVCVKNHEAKCFIFTVLDIYRNSHKSLQMLKVDFKPQELQGNYFFQTSPKWYAMSYLAQSPRAKSSLGDNWLKFNSYDLIWGNFVRFCINFA